ncbi:hypothetical protein ABIB90_008235 [Bradyrhizobium sp. JR4.1]
MEARQRRSFPEDHNKQAVDLVAWDCSFTEGTSGCAWNGDISIGQCVARSASRAMKLRREGPTCRRELAGWPDGCAIARWHGWLTACCSLEADKRARVGCAAWRLRSRATRHKQPLPRLRSVQGLESSGLSSAAVAFALTVAGTLRRCSDFLSCCGDDGPDSEPRQGLDRHWPHRHASACEPGSYIPGDSEARSARWRSLHLPGTSRRSGQDPRHDAIGISRQVHLAVGRPARYRSQRRSSAIRELATSRTRLCGSWTRLKI